MRLRTLIRRSLRFHWRSNLGVVLGATIGTTALVGALVVGDSVKGSLRTKATERLGGAWVEVALNSGDRLFGTDLAARIFIANSNRIVSAGAEADQTLSFPMHGLQGGHLGTVLLSLPASIGRQDGSARANHVSVFAFDPAASPPFSWGHQPEGFKSEEAVWVNRALANHLGVEEGDPLILRVNKPSVVGLDAAISPRGDSTVAIRATVGRILPPLPGDFSLVDRGGTAMNVFLSPRLLEAATGLSGRGNILLLPPAFRYRPMSMWERYQVHREDWSVGQGPHPLQSFDWLDVSHSRLGVIGDGDQIADLASTLLADVWTLDDAESKLVPCGSAPGSLELRTSRVFLDAPIERAALAAQTNTRPLLTYISSLILSGTNATPYSMVTAAGAPWTPADLADDEIVLNQWLADDLDAHAGDEVSLVYYDPESGAHLEERTNVFRVHSIVPMELPWADRTLMPGFPGIEKAESTADWDTAFPLKYKIRPKDDAYWRQFRGTPKAFITLAAGKHMWANRFGNITAVRFELPTGAESGRPPGDSVEPASALEARILATLHPADLGFRFEPVRERALKAAQESQDFGGLFIGFSFFLIGAALILMALLFQFGLEQRSPEVGTLLALGFTGKQVRRLLLGEGAVLASLGGIGGTLGGVFYAKGMLLGLTTIWRDAVGETSLKFHVTAGSLGIGLCASTFVAVATIWFALRRQAKQPAIALLNAGRGIRNADRSPGKPRAAKWPLIVGGASLAVALGMVVWAIATGDTTNAETFFSAGALVLTGGLALLSRRLQRCATASPDTPEASVGGGRPLTAAGLAFRGLARRRSRSVATAALLASGSFLILSIGVFRLDANRDATQPGSGTGGFALIGEPTVPIAKDLNTAEGREFFALDQPQMEDVRFVQFRVRAGDEASCLNLNRAQTPRLLGVDPTALQGRFTFAKAAPGLDRSEGWKLLNAERQTDNVGTDPVPAIGDLNSIVWAMGKKVGDTIDYTDQRGRPFKVRIVAAVANSILQGNLIIDEAAFVRRFPDEAGFQYLLMDAPADRSADVAAGLSRAMEDYGMEITPAVERLNQFNAVQNTYLGTFQIIGGLGLLLGSAGLGIVVLRNVLERRGELAVLMAVGFRKRRIEGFVLMEHAGLLGLGLALGLVAATVAVLPTLLAPGSHLPYATLLPTLGGVLMNGLIWTWVASRLAIRGDLLEALRNE